MARIGVNALYLLPGKVGGTEIYLRELLAALARIDRTNEYFVFHNVETGNGLVPRQPNFRACPQAVAASNRPARIVWEQVVLPLEALRFQLDVLFNPGFTAPVLAPCRNVTVFHDLQHKRHPEYFRWFDLPFWRLLLWASAHRSSRLVAVSEATKTDLLRFYRIAESKVAVVPHGVGQEFFELKRGVTDPFVLCVSTLHPHKNIERLVRAFAGRPRAHRLVLAGIKGFHTEAVERLIAELGVQDRVHVTGWIPREELLDLYRCADAFVYPSTFEGFGMPVLEALAAGIPTACSDIPVLREVAGDSAAYFDPLDEGALAKALDAITSDEALRKRLATDGPKRARGFSWDDTARRTLAALMEAS